MSTRERIDMMAKGFTEGLVGLDDLIQSIPAGEEHDFGYEAARAALAPYAWSKAVGERLDTTRVGDLLDVSRQALAKRVQSGSLLGLPGKGTTYFPAWQFDVKGRRIRPEAEKILRIFKSRGAYDPHMIAAWMRTPHPALQQATPAELIENGKGVDELFTVAAETARSWAS